MNKILSILIVAVMVAQIFARPDAAADAEAAAKAAAAATPATPAATPPAAPAAPAAPTKPSLPGGDMIGKFMDIPKEMMSGMGNFFG